MNGSDGPEYADFHALRHSYLTMLGKTADLRTVQELAGHSRPEITARYVHKRHDDLADAVGKLPSLVATTAPSVAHGVAQAVCNGVHSVAPHCTTGRAAGGTSTPEELPESVGYFAELRRGAASCTSEGDGTRTRNLRIDSPARDVADALESEANQPLAVSTCTTTCTTPDQLAPELLRIAEVWHRLPPHIRAAVLALVNTAAPAGAPLPADPLDDSLPPGFEQRKSEASG